ncbi:anti-sigma factor [Paenibacillus sp. OV219]|uniref:anti-sigma factor family protein n=1 Tax=Paenibacillus sp. OV219 TaxID=1884377 RepID=UPI0008D396B0|nr:zf-HC2 domain-containing protein [Paenibacillus sp. OV219]SEP17800.1 Putative zinc-finger [Paenibacillus sp. OV219]
MSKHPEEQLSAYLDDELTQDERREIEEHLETCESCQALLEDMADNNYDLVQTFSLIEVPMNFEVRVMQSIGAEEERQFAGKGWVLALLLGLLTLGVFYLLTGAIIGKLIHGWSKLVITLIYASSHFILSVPALTGGTIVLSLIILVTSFISLKRLLQTSTS